MRDIDELLYASAPEVDLSVAGPAMAALAAAVTGKRRGLVGRTKMKIAALVTAAAVLVPAAGVAGVHHFTAQTGGHPAQAGSDNDTTEYIDMCAPDVLQFVLTLAPTGRSLPAGTTWADIARRIVRAAASSCPPHDVGMTEQVTGLKASYLGFSECPWEHYFLTVSGPDAQAERRRAGAAIADAEVAMFYLGVQGDSGWIEREAKARAADAAWVRNDYQVNCELPAGSK